MPILYSFRRCPFAIRARMAIASSNHQVELREVLLKDKPVELLALSPKATVPVLLLEDNTLLDESLDIMYWAFTTEKTSDLHLPQFETYHKIDLILENDTVFKNHLDHYKYADRFPEKSAQYYRSQGELFLNTLEKRLLDQQFLFGKQVTIIDYAIFPFIRQFASVDLRWFEQSEYVQLKQWLQYFLKSKLFESVMKKSPQWHPDSLITHFPSKT